MKRLLLASALGLGLLAPASAQVNVTPQVGLNIANLRAYESLSRKHDELWQDNADLRDELHALANRVESVTVAHGKQGDELLVQQKLVEHLIATRATGPHAA